MASINHPIRKNIVLLVLIFFYLAGCASSTTVPIPSTTPIIAWQKTFLAVNWYQQDQITTADLWNSGPDGHSGMGTYQSSFNGYFYPNLDQQWQQTPADVTSAVEQSRGIYMNVEAYRTAGPQKGQRFLNGITKGIDFLQAHFLDTRYGGYYWQVANDGTVRDDQKQGYGNAHVMMVLAQAYSVTHNPNYLQDALNQLAIIEKHFVDPAYPGSYRPNYNRDFSQIQGNNNIDVITHYLEGLLALFDVTTGATHNHLTHLVQQEGDFIASHLYHNEDGYTDRGYVAYNYDAHWQPSQQPYTRETQWSGALQASTGHNIELAYLVSRAIERGFNAKWLDVGYKLIKFCLLYAIDPKTGGMLYEITDYHGKPLPGNPDNSLYIYWPQAETARALLHYTVVRGADFGKQFKKAEAFFNQYMTDQHYGGLWQGVDASTLKPGDNTTKGDIWKADYHENMYFTEVLRLGAKYPTQIAALNKKWAAA
ncbi:MAG: AGE family epimerase/isomerase [Ktedonobacteraceae bacterium]|nr:AGE family epimerase/isomerase [Ktedonobacteraceae bacterium]